MVPELKGSQCFLRARCLLWPLRLVWSQEAGIFLGYLVRKLELGDVP